MTPPPPPKNKKTPLVIKLLSAILLPPTCFHCFPKGLCTMLYIYSLQIPISIEKSIFSCHLHLHQKTRKSQNLQLMIKSLSAIPLPQNLHPPLPEMFPHDPLDSQSQTPHIHLKISINISKCLQHKKSRKRHEN